MGGVIDFGWYIIYNYWPEDQGLIYWIINYNNFMNGTNYPQYG